jgi:uncharacterized membrane protein
MSWARAFQLRQYVKGSLWVLPLLGCVLGVVAAQFSVALDRAVTLPSGWRYSPTTASAVLAAVVGAMVGLLGFVVTVSVLVVQQATGTLSPRYMRLWYRDRLQKVVLASFAGTFTYAFSLLSRVESAFVPDIGVTVTGVAVATCLVLLLVYVNRFTHSLRPVAVAATVAEAGRGTLTGQISTLLAQQPAHDEQWYADSTPLLTVRIGRGGAIQAFSGRGLIKEAVRSDCLLVLLHGVGDFLPAGAPVIEAYRTGSGSGSGSQLAPEARALQGMVATGTERTIEQDPAFALRILVDIAIRALSPAVNDPTTAVQVLNYIEDVLHTLVTVPLRSHYSVADQRGVTRVVVPGRGWTEFLSLAMTEIRLYGATAPQVCRRLRAVLLGLIEVAPLDHQPAISAEITRLDASIEASFPDPTLREFAGRSDRQGIGGRSSEEAVDRALDPETEAVDRLPAQGLSPHAHDARLRNRLR